MENTSTNLNVYVRLEINKPHLQFWLMPEYRCLLSHLTTQPPSNGLKTEVRSYAVSCSGRVEDEELYWSLLQTLNSAEEAGLEVHWLVHPYTSSTSKRQRNIASTASEAIL